MGEDAEMWQEILAEAREEAELEPVLADFLKTTLLERASLEDALAFHLARKLGTRAVTATALHQVFSEAFAADASIGAALRADLRAVRDRDPACSRLSVPLLYFKGFHALQTHRVAHRCRQPHCQKDGPEHPDPPAPRHRPRVGAACVGPIEDARPDPGRLASGVSSTSLWFTLILEPVTPSFEFRPFGSFPPSITSANGRSAPFWV